MKNLFTILFILLIADLNSQNITDFFTEQATGFTTPQRGIQNISVVDENIVWALAFDGSGNNEIVQEFTKTIDGGNIWVPGTIDIGNPDLGIAMLHAIDENIALITAYPTVSGDIGGVYKTIDAGVTWTRAPNMYDDNNSYVSNIYFWDENKGIVIGDPVDGYFEIYTTDDGGDNWTRVPAANLPNPETGEYPVIGKIDATEDAIWWKSNKHFLYRSYDFGFHFEKFNMPFDFDYPLEIGSIAFTDENDGYYFLLGYLYKSFDGGENWVLAFPETGFCYDQHAHAVKNSGTLFTSNHEGTAPLIGLSFTIDHGFNFEVCSGVDPITEVKTYKINNFTHIWAGSFNQSETEGGMYSTLIGCSVDEIKNYQSIIYPNPVENLLHIQSENNIKQLKLLNAFGKTLFETPYNANECTQNIDNYPSGIYIIQVTTQNQTETHRFIKK